MNRELTLALLSAVRARAVERNKVRDEIRRHSEDGELRNNSEMPSWQTFQRAEVALNAAVTAWEESEGIVDK